VGTAGTERGADYLRKFRAYTVLIAYVDFNIPNILVAPLRSTRCGTDRLHNPSCGQEQLAAFVVLFNRYFLAVDKLWITLRPLCPDLTKSFQSFTDLQKSLKFGCHAIKVFLLKRGFPRIVGISVELVIPHPFIARRLKRRLLLDRQRPGFSTLLVLLFSSYNLFRSKARVKQGSTFGRPHEK